jgi:hypothetical protein
MLFKAFDRLFSFFHPGKKHEQDRKRRLMRQLVKDLTANRFARFYKPRMMEVQPGMGKFFYTLYHALSHAQAFLQKAAASTRLKQITVEAFLDAGQLDARQRLDADFLERRAKTMPIIEVSRLLKEDLGLLAGVFDADFIALVDGCYNQVLTLVYLAEFDYFLFLQKFDPALLERNFNLPPQFKAVRGTTIVEEVKDFLEIFYPFDTEADWTLPLRILKTYKDGLDVITAAEWSKLTGSLRELRRSAVLELMVRHISQDPAWELKVSPAEEHIAAAYLEDRRREVDHALTGFLSSHKQNLVNSLVRDLFRDSDILQYQYYSGQDREGLSALGLEGFIHAQSLNYLKAFLVEFFEKDIRDLCELLLIRGLWSSMEQSREMFGAFYRLQDRAGLLASLEQSLSENGEEGARLRSVMAKSGRSRSQLHNLERMVQWINEQSWDLLCDTADAFVQLGQWFKAILVDAKNDGSLIKNFRELQRETVPPLPQRLILAYRQIYQYLQIQQILCESADSLLDLPDA